jgi:hypothetical protein
MHSSHGAGDGLGGYVNDSRGVHHISPLACIHCDANEDAFGWLEVFEDKLRLHMAGLQPDASRLPSGWPQGDLPLPGGGTLSAGSTGDMTGVVGFFLWLSFIMMRTLTAPLSPVLRMLTSEGDDDEANGAAAAPGAHYPTEGDGMPVAAPLEQVAAPLPPSGGGGGGGGGKAAPPPSGAPAPSGDDDEGGVIV